MESALTKFLYSRYSAALTVIMLIAATYIAFVNGSTLPITGDKGPLLPSANEWFKPGETELCINIGINILIMTMMVVINHHYNFIKALTLLYVGIYAIMQLAWPDMMTQLYSGSILALVLLFCLSLLMNCFDRPGPLTNRKIFMIFALLSAGSMTQYAFVVYLPVMLIGCIQMRIMSFKVFLSAIIGLMTPWAIVLGSGIATVDNLHLPQITSVFNVTNLMDWLSFVVTIVLTLLLLWAAEVLTLFKVLSYNAQRRACNGVLTITAVFTTLAMAADYTNLIAYIPVLNVCAAFAVTLFFTHYHTSKSYIPILSIYALYTAIYLWKVVI